MGEIMSHISTLALKDIIHEYSKLLKKDLKEDEIIFYTRAIEEYKTELSKRDI